MSKSSLSFFRGVRSAFSKVSGLTVSAKSIAAAISIVSLLAIAVIASLGLRDAILGSSRFSPTAHAPASDLSQTKSTTTRADIDASDVATVLAAHLLGTADDAGARGHDLFPAIKPPSIDTVRDSFDQAYINSDPNRILKADPAPGKLAWASTPNPARAIKGARPQDRDEAGTQSRMTQDQLKPQAIGKPQEEKLIKAGTFDGDLTRLPYKTPKMKDRPEREAPEIVRGAIVPPQVEQKNEELPERFAPAAPAPTPLFQFDGQDFATWGDGHPPDTNGDVGPTYYIQTVNTSIGIYNKTTGSRDAAFTFDTFMSQGNFGNLCDTDNFGDPVVLYDSFEDRWFITDFAFTVDISGNVTSNSYQCFAVSKTGDPVLGGWNYYYIVDADFLGDYPKFGVWPDGIYMSANMFGFAASGTFQYPRLRALNKMQMYAGSPTVQVVTFNAPAAEFTLLPANARLQSGTPPAGSPNYFAVVWQLLSSESVYKFHVDWNSISTSTLTGPFISTDSNWWEQLSAANQTAPTPGNKNDELYPRLMMQNQYSNIGGVESLWTSHTVGAGNPGAVNATATQSAVRFYQVNVTGGTVAAAPTQAWTHSPDASLWRYMPSLAVDRLGDMAIGYSTSNATTNPALKYAGRLAGDAVNSITQTEQTMIQGTGAQTGSCGGTCTRWGDYSAMTLDPDGCRFWYTNEYYNVSGLNDLTRIGSFKLNPACTAFGAGGTVSGTVTINPGGSPINGATVTFGARATTTNASGNYSFTGIPAGTYPTITASFAGYGSSTLSTVVVVDSSTTTKNFSLTAAPATGCLTDTSQADFQLGVPTNTDLTSSPGDVTLARPLTLDQSMTSVSGSGVVLDTTNWHAQTFTAGASGPLLQADINLFCSFCSGTTPNLTLSIRATSGGLPTGADLASATISGFSNGSSAYYSVSFSSPVTVTSGTIYAIVVRPVSNPSAGNYAATISGSNVYSGGQRVFSTNSGSSWAAGSPSRDIGFHTYVLGPYSTSGNLISSVKDANPAAGNTPQWTTLSWTNAALPSGTTLKFQAAASNNVNGPFSFVGPDGTASTFFTTSGASLSQFNGFRYLKYEALLSTSNTANTPTVNDVTACFTSASSAATTLAAATASGTFGGTASLSATLTSSAVGVSGKTIAFTLNGSSVGSAVTNGSGVATLAGASLAGINVGSYPTGVGASFAGDASYNSSSGTNSLTIGQASSSTTINCSPGTFTFTGAAITPCTATVTGAGGLNTTTSVTYASNTNVGTATANASYGGDGNHTGSTATQVTFAITQAGSTTTINCAPGTFTYTGSAITPCTATVTRVGASNTTATVVYANNVNVGTATANASYGGDSNHTGSTATQVTFAITQAGSTTTINCSPGSFTFTGSAITPCTATVTRVGDANTTATVSYANNINVGTATANASYAGDGNHTGSTATQVTFAITQAASTTTIDCTPGTFTFTGSGITPCVATVTRVGTSNTTATVVYANNINVGTATANASYAGDGNHTGSTATQVTFAITQAASTTTIDCSPGSFTFTGSAITPCTATVTRVGVSNTTATVVYANNINVGTATANASYAGDTNHTGSTATQVTFAITQAGSTTTIDCTPGTFTFTGSAITPCTATVTRVGTSNTTATISYANNINVGTATANASYAGDTNHTGSTATQVTFAITQAGSTTTIDCSPGSFTFTGSAITPCTATVTRVGASNTTASVVYANNINVGTATANASYGGDGNHTGSTATQVTFAITQAASTTTIDCSPGSFTFTGSAITPCTATVTRVGTSNTTATVVYASNTGVGTATANASYAGDGNHTGSTATQVTFAITKANPSCTIPGYTLVYNAVSHTSTGSCLGLLGETLTGIDLSGTTHTDPGIYTDPWTYTDSTGNYNNAGSTVADTIQSGTVAGHIDYAVLSKSVRNVALNAPGSVPVSGSTDVSGNYALTKFGAGAYTVTPSRAAQPICTVNGVQSNDAALIAQHVVGLITLSPAAVEAGKVDGLSALSSFDAALIARWVVCLPTAGNQAGQWKFNPANVAHPSGVINQTLTENYSATLMGDVNGDWNPALPARPFNEDPKGIRAAVADETVHAGSIVTVPLSIERLEGKGLTSYQFDIEYDPKVLRPVENAADIAGTRAAGMTVVSNSPVDGLLKVVVFGAIPVSGDGVYANLRFAAIGKAGSTTTLNINGFSVDDGSVGTTTAAGRVSVTANDHPGSLTGRLLSSTGVGLGRLAVTLTSSNGETVTAMTSSFGYFSFEGLALGETYTVTVESKRYHFNPTVISITDNMADVELIGSP